MSILLIQVQNSAGQITNVLLLEEELKPAPTKWREKAATRHQRRMDRPKYKRQNTFQKCFESVLPQNTIVFCHLPNNCYHICTYPTVMQIILSTKDDLRPHQPPPVPLSAPCWHRHHRCHGCRVVPAIATAQRHCRCHCHTCRCLLQPH